MKFVAYSALAIALLLAPSQATLLGRKHHHHHGHELVSTLPDVRADTVSDADIAAHEAARAEAAKVKKNPQAALLATIKADLEAINTNMSFGVSYSQTKRNDSARDLCTKVAAAILDYSTKLIAKVEGGANETLTEQNAHNIAAIIFYDVQLQDA